MGELTELSGLGPGAHVCCVVASSEQLEAWAARFLRDGALAGQKLFRVVAPAHPVPVDDDVIVIDPMSLNGDGMVTPEAVCAMYRREAAKAREEGFSGMRVVADMRWALAHPPLRAALTAFELQLDAVAAELDATVVCLYSEGDYAAGELADLLAVHPITSGAAPAEPGFRLWNIDRGAWEVAGEVDESNVETFKHAVSAASAAGPLRRMRCAGLRFISAAGIRVLAGAAATAQPDRSLTIQGASTILRRCWAILELDERAPQVRLEPDLGEEVAG